MAHRHTTEAHYDMPCLGKSVGHRVLTYRSLTVIPALGVNAHQHPPQVKRRLRIWLLRTHKLQQRSLSERDVMAGSQVLPTLRDAVQKAGQSHLLASWDQLSSDQRTQLTSDIQVLVVPPILTATGPYSIHVG